MSEERRREKPGSFLSRPSSRKGDPVLYTGCTNDEITQYCILQAQQDPIDSYKYPERVMVTYLSLAVAETGEETGGVPAPLGLLTLAYSLSRGSSSGMAAGSLP